MVTSEARSTVIDKALWAFSDKFFCFPIGNFYFETDTSFIQLSY